MNLFNALCSGATGYILKSANEEEIINAIKDINGVTTEVIVPTLGNVTPTLHVTWNKSKVKITTKELQDSLRNGNPSIEIIANGEEHITITSWVMKTGEEKLVAKRLKEDLSKSVVS